MVSYRKIATFYLPLLAIGIFFYSNSYASYAQTPQKSIQEQISDLLNQVSALQSQLANLTGGISQFNRNLRQGDIGEDVRELQKLLNKDPQTLVASSGPGSLGQETTFFGPATLSAVKKFQQKYSSEVLTPVGLFSPTGFVGESTRAQLNFLSSSISQDPPDQPAAEPLTEPSQPSQSSLPLSQLTGGTLPKDFNFSESLFFTPDADTPMPTLISDNVAEMGSEVTLYGSGFTSSGNTVHFNEDFSISGLSSNNNAIEFNIPTNISPGPYDLTVTNGKGDSETSVFFIVSSDSTSLSPTVSQVTPSEGTYGTEVTILGTGFTPTNNQVRSSYGNISNLDSPNGTTLTFKVEPFPDTPDLDTDDLAGGVEWAIHFYVVNSNGISSGAVRSS